MPRVPLTQYISITKLFNNRYIRTQGGQVSISTLYTCTLGQDAGGIYARYNCKAGTLESLRANDWLLEQPTAGPCLFFAENLLQRPKKLRSFYNYDPEIFVSLFCRGQRSRFFLRSNERPKEGHAFVSEDTVGNLFRLNLAMGCRQPRDSCWWGAASCRGGCWGRRHPYAAGE